MHKFLALDTSTLKGSLSLIETCENYTNQTVLYHHSWSRQNTHSEYLIPSIQETLKKSFCLLEDIEAFLTTNGPGSFTGLRVGLNTVKSLAYINNKNIHTINSLENLALSTYEQREHLKLPILCILNAFKNMVYLATFKWNEGTLETLQPPSALEIKKLESFISEQYLCVGDGYHAYKEVFSSKLKNFLIRQNNYDDHPNSLNFLPKISSEWLENSKESWKTTTPLYIRQSSAEEKLREGLLKPVIQRQGLKN